MRSKPHPRPRGWRRPRWGSLTGRRGARSRESGSRGSGSSGTALFDGSEGRRAAGVADRIIREKSDDVDLNVEKAVGRFEAEARELRHSAKKQRANSKAGGGGKGPRGKGGRSGGDKPQGKAGKRRK
uniref:Ribosome biogenesis regulatory protein n=1 Tax=Tetraselmis sp. GSL018 TaxID=582737 RepID=A0A061QPT7_9CHLO